MAQAKNILIVPWIFVTQIGHSFLGRFDTQFLQQTKWLQGESNTWTSSIWQILHFKRWDRHWFSLSISHIRFCSSPCSSSLILWLICCKACWCCCMVWSFCCTLCSRDMDFFRLLSRALSFIFMSSSNLTTIKQFCYTRCNFFLFFLFPSSRPQNTPLILVLGIIFYGFIIHIYLYLSVCHGFQQTLLERVGNLQHKDKSIKGWHIYLEDRYLGTKVMIY